MVNIDVRFSESKMKIIKNMIGKRLIKYMHDPFEFSTSVYGIVGLCLEEENVVITNLTEVRDYYGTEEDVAVLKIEQTDESEIHSFIEGESMIETPVNSLVEQIIIVNENQSLFKDGVQIYDVNLTRGIIFVMEDGLQISFEKNIWFSEDITIQRGYNLIDTYSPESEFCENWELPYVAKCERESIVIE